MNQTSRARLFVVRALMLSMLLTLLGRLWYLQVVSGAEYAARVSSNDERQQFTPAVRGRILDDEGVELVRNRTALVISVNASDLPTGRLARAAVLDRLVPLVNPPGAARLDEGRIAAMITPCGRGPDGHQVPRPCWTGEPFAPVPVATFVVGAGSDELTGRALTIKQDAADFPGVSVDLRAVSDYPQAGASADTTLAAQILGYVAPVVDTDLARHPDYLQPRDTIGRGGLEASYDRDLRGTPGLQRLRVDALGNATDTISDTPEVAGSDLVTNLDATVQRAAETALAKAVTVTAPALGTHPTSAAAVVMTTDGRVVALASYPSYDLGATFGSSLGVDAGTYDRLTDPHGPLPILDRATSGVYSPGSAWKVVSASAMLGNGLVRPGTPLSCPSTFPIGSQLFHNFEGESPPSGDLTEMLKVSCDTVFDSFAYQQWIADGRQRAVPGLPPARELFTREAQAYGFGRATGIDAGEASGSILDRAAVHAAADAQRPYDCQRARQLGALGRQASTEYGDVQAGCLDPGYLQGGDAAQFAIGQGFTVNVTPLQLARAYAAVANGGTLWQPTIAKAVVRPDGSLVRTISPRSAGTVPVTPGDLDYLRQGFYKVVHAPGGTAAGAFAGFPVPLAGKTGTAEVHGLDANGNDYVKGDNSWFMSFGPYAPGTGTSARYVVGVVVPDSTQGAEVAAPAARDIWSAIYGVGADGRATRPTATAPALLPCYVPGTTHPARPSPTCAAARTAPAPAPAPPGYSPAASRPPVPAVGLGAAPQATASLGRRRSALADITRSAPSVLAAAADATGEPASPGRLEGDP